MSEKTQILLLSICMIINVYDSLKVHRILNQIEENEETMREYINKRFKEKADDNKNTNVVPFQKK